MVAHVEIPDSIAGHLEELAEREGITTSKLIQRLVTDHVAGHRTLGRLRKRIVGPLIPASETGPIRDFTGEELDDIVAREDFASRR
jgi:metal-responsive CopG/Arc/MetJ family transcriptional regulator